MSKEKAVEKVVEATDSVTVQVIDKIVDVVGPAITAIAESLGTNAEHVMMILSKQAIAVGIEGFTITGLVIGVVIAWSRFCKWWRGKIENDDWDSDGNTAMIGISCGIAILALLIGGANLISGIKHIINPEYYALQEVMTFIAKFR